MAISQSSLSSRIQTALQAAFTIQDTSILKKVSDAIAGAVVDEIHENAVVNCEGPDPQGGVVTSVGTVI